ncbi:MAG: TrmH family RNA methyltransferase [Gaiellaceae bacterium]
MRIVRRLATRHQRERLGLFVCEGEDLVAAALDVGIAPEVALVDAERPALRERLASIEEIEPALMAELSTLGHPPRVIAVFRRDALPRGAQATTLAIWRVGDPGNIGTLLRSLDAFGGALALSEGCADPTGPKALRAAAGATFRVPTCRFDEPSGRRVALVARGGVPLAELEFGEQTTFVLGAEREGLPEDVLARCEAQATIPLAGEAESLNVAIASAIALYELAGRS